MVLAIICMYTLYQVPLTSSADSTGGGTGDSGSNRRQCKRRRGKKRRVSAHNRSTAQRQVKNRSHQSEPLEPDIDEGKKTEEQGETVQEEEGGQDMLSHVCSDSEEAVRRSLVRETRTMLGSLGGGTSCTVDDGLYSPPDATCVTVIIPVSCNQVY